MSTALSNRVLPRFALLLFAALLCAFLAACGASQAPRATLESKDPDLVLWPFAEKAIRLQFSADRNLNLFDSRAHSIQICVYQLSKPDAFTNLAKTREGVAKLLQAELFDSSVKSVSRLFIQPLEEASYALDRMEGATFVGIVGGYFDSTPANSVIIREIKPKTRRGGLMWTSKIYSAGTLDLALRLTARAMVEDGEQKREGDGQKREDSGQKREDSVQKREEQTKRDRKPFDESFGNSFDNFIL